VFYYLQSALEIDDDDDVVEDMINTELGCKSVEACKLIRKWVSCQAGDVEAYLHEKPWRCREVGDVMIGPVLLHRTGQVTVVLKNAVQSRSVCFDVKYRCVML